jgi:hypothetical protein
MMQRVENSKPCFPRRIQDLQHIRNTVICFRNSFEAIPYFAFVGNKIVIGIDDEKRSDLSVELKSSMFFPSMRLRAM